ncbi:uncharacterized protein LOC142235757 [Haematobia irritans]|uniref:uncharacterized protein LOC142235757 n=1 Tax=Haematobia irritans TaxID=7368 RepID=UPI003F5063A2
MGILLASKTFGVPHTTLQRYAKSEETIEDILKWSHDTRADIRSLCFQIASINNIPNKFSVMEECAGKYWLNGFIRRHRNIISLRKPTETSMDSVREFSRENVDLYFNLLEGEYNKHNVPPSRIWNVDETGILVVPSQQPQVIARKGKRQIGMITSAERGLLVTIITCMSAGEAHTRNIEVLDLARAHHVTIISLPPHSSHKLQPLDKTFMGALKKYYNEEIRRFMREEGRKLTPYVITGLFNKAYLKV